MKENITTNVKAATVRGKVWSIKASDGQKSSNRGNIGERNFIRIEDSSLSDLGLKMHIKKKGYKHLHKIIETHGKCNNLLNLLLNLKLLFNRLDQT